MLQNISFHPRSAKPLQGGGGSGERARIGIPVSLLFRWIMTRCRKEDLGIPWARLYSLLGMRRGGLAGTYKCRPPNTVLPDAPRLGIVLPDWVLFGAPCPPDPDPLTSPSPPDAAAAMLPGSQLASQAHQPRLHQTPRFPRAERVAV